MAPAREFSGRVTLKLDATKTGGSSASRIQIPSHESHVNLFQEEERMIQSEIKNGSKLVDKKALENKEWEDKHTMFLGETRDGKKESPWYGINPTAKTIAVNNSSLASSKSLDSAAKR